MAPNKSATATRPSSMANSARARTAAPVSHPVPSRGHGPAARGGAIPVGPALATTGDSDESFAEYPKAMYGKNPGDYKEAADPDEQAELEKKGYKDEPQHEPSSHGHVFGARSK